MVEMDDSDEILLRPELEAQIDEAMRHASDPADEEVAVAARYDRGTDLLIVELKSGQRIAIPREDLQGLAGAEADDVAEIEIVGLGTGLHWERLDADLHVAGLTKGIYGSKKWMEGLAQRRRARLERAS